jgi:hypothetical protein
VQERRFHCTDPVEAGALNKSFGKMDYQQPELVKIQLID